MQEAVAFFCSRCGTRRGGPGACDRDGTQLSQVTASSLIGTEVGNYVLVQLLGEGGMGGVYRAVHPTIGAEVAIKVLHASPESGQGLVQRFLLEAQAVNRVRHRGLIKILDTGRLPDRRPYLVMELLDGVPLAAAIGKLTPALACHIAAEALDALDAVHGEDIVHRDLKPANVFLTREGRVVVLDFGIAKLLTPSDTDPRSNSGLVGTPEYMAPEQTLSKPLDRRTDVYAIGLVLYESVSGRRPFAATTTFELLVQHVERPVTSPRNYVPALSPEVAELILRALEKDPARRFPTAAALATALRAASDPVDADELGRFVDAIALARPPVPLETSTPAAAVTTPNRPRAAPLIPAATAPDRAHDVVVTVPDRPALASPVGVRDRPARGFDRTPSRATIPESRRADVPPTGPNSPQDSGAAGRGPSRARLWWLGASLGAIAAGASVYALTRSPEPPPPVVAAVPARPDAAPPSSVTIESADAPTATGELEIKSRPDGATISIDHVARGVTPGTIQLQPGAYVVELALPGHEAFVESIEVRAGARVNLIAPLKRTPRGATAGRAIAPGKTTTMVPSGGSGDGRSGSAGSSQDGASGGSAGGGSAGSGSGRRKGNPFPMAE